MDEERLANLKGQLNHVPTLPGVYLWKDSEGQVIYVGKAKQLRARMRQYLNFQDDRLKIPLLVSQIDSFEYVVCESEHESLVLERNLIAQYAPYFNADFKDDKSYPFIGITKGDVFPQSSTRVKRINPTRATSVHIPTAVRHAIWWTSLAGWLPFALAAVPIGVVLNAAWKIRATTSLSLSGDLASTAMWAWALVPVAARSPLRITSATLHAWSASFPASTTSFSQSLSRR